MSDEQRSYTRREAAERFFNVREYRGRMKSPLVDLRA